ncbi:MAG: tyrosinase family protein [Solirubrobacterales bacterium]
MNKPPGVLHVRREVRSLPPGDPTLQHYADAVAAMQQEHKDERVTWLYQAAIHGTYEKPAKKLWNQCTHGTWFFVSWHRIFLFYFEEIVRSFVKELHGPEAAEAWALPYWNYCRGGRFATLPEAFRQPASSSNPLYVKERAAVINAGGEIRRAAYESTKALARPHFIGVEEFGGAPEEVRQFGQNGGIFEITPHGTVHDSVGGQTGWMSDIRKAAKDPIFWLHHCNIDRIWSQWIAQGGGRRNPGEAAWLDQPFHFFDPEGKEVSKTCREVVHTEALHYKYDAVDGEPAAASAQAGGAPPPASAPAQEEKLAVSAPADPPSQPPKIVGASTEKVTLAGTPAAIPVEIDERAREEVREASTEEDPRRLYLNIEDIEGDAHPGTPYGIYVNLPENADSETRAKHHIGNLSFFGAGFGGEPVKDEPAHSQRVRIVVGPLLRALGDGKHFDEGEINVTFLPLLPNPPEGAGDDSLKEVQEQAEEAPVHIGRVSLGVDES